nr:acyltransferase [Saccharomonospora sp. CUA-673]
MTSTSTAPVNPDTPVPATPETEPTGTDTPPPSTPAPAAGARTSNRKMSWDVIRVLAISFVVAGHVTAGAQAMPDIEPYPGTLRLPFGTFTLLVLSGFFMGPTLRKLSVGAWLQARLARLLPAYFVAMLVTFLVLRAVVPTFNDAVDGDGPWYLPGADDLLRNLLLVHEWTGTMHERIDASYWTLPVQVAAFVAPPSSPGCGGARRPAAARDPPSSSGPSSQPPPSAPCSAASPRSCPPPSACTTPICSPQAPRSGCGPNGASPAPTSPRCCSPC